MSSPTVDPTTSLNPIGRASTETLPRPPALLSASRWGVVALAAIGFGVPANVLAPFSRQAGSRLWAQWAQLACSTLGIELDVVDRQGGDFGSPPYVFVYLNQQSLVDSLIFPATMDAVPLTSAVRPLTNIEFAMIPLFGWHAVLEGSPIIVRQWRAQSRWAFERAVRMAAKGENFAVSIEGKRSRAGELGPYRKTPIVFAIRAQATIVPVFLSGTRARLPFGEWRVRPGRVRATLLERIATRGLSIDARDDLVNRLRAIATRELESASGHPSAF